MGLLHTFRKQHKIGVSAKQTFVSRKLKAKAARKEKKSTAHADRLKGKCIRSLTKKKQRNKVKNL